MPSIPMAFSASFTSSSLNGWMIASIFFMALSFEGISFLAVHAEIQAFDFLVLGHSQPHGGVAYLQNHQCSHNRQRPCDPTADRLVQHLAAFAIHQTERHRLSGRILEAIVHRSEERRVGKECRSRWS